jgi:hypothetical protein
VRVTVGRLLDQTDLELEGALGSLAGARHHGGDETDEYEGKKKSAHAPIVPRGQAAPPGKRTEKRRRKEKARRRRGLFDSVADGRRAV